MNNFIRNIFGYNLTPKEEMFVDNYVLTSPDIEDSWSKVQELRNELQEQEGNYVKLLKEVKSSKYAEWKLAIEGKCRKMQDIIENSKDRYWQGYNCFAKVVGGDVEDDKFFISVMYINLRCYNNEVKEIKIVQEDGSIDAFFIVQYKVNFMFQLKRNVKCLKLISRRL